MTGGGKMVLTTEGIRRKRGLQKLPISEKYRA